MYDIGKYVENTCVCMIHMAVLYVLLYPSSIQMTDNEMLPN